MAQARLPGERRGAPPSLIFDSRSDTGEVLWQRLHARARPHAFVSLIVHLKNGSTRVGRLFYFDRTVLTLSVEGSLEEMLFGDIAHVIVATS